MPAIGMALAWAGYTVTLWGYCLIKGYNVPLSALANPVHPYAWPAAGPQQIPDTSVLPVSSAALAAATAASAPAAAVPPATVAGGAGNAVQAL